MRREISEARVLGIKGLMMENAKGSCLCGAVTYAITGPIQMFQYCHCSRCRKTTGSAHASNMFVPAEQFNWLSGAELVKRFEDPSAKYYATEFCSQCGSSLPWKTRNNKSYVVPAGTLNDKIEARPRQNIFWGSRADWYEHVADLPRHEQLPPKKQ